MLAALFVFQAISLTLVVDPATTREVPLRMADIGRALRPPGDSREWPPPRMAPPDMGPPAMQPPGLGPDPPLFNASRPLLDDALTVIRSSITPAPAGLTASPSLRAALASMLGIDSGSLLFFAKSAPDRADGPETQSRSLRESFLAARHLGDGSWLIMEHRVAGFPTASQKRAMLLFAVGIAALLPLAWLFAHTLSAPISRFAEAAVRLGRDGSGSMVPREGPAEMLLAVDSFNAMQARLNRMLQERTYMVAAIAHDLRTPLTRLAFRLDDLPRPLAEKVNADIQEMKSMISTALDFIRDRSLNTTREQLDFRLLVESIVDDHRDLEHDVMLELGRPITLHGNRISLRRLVSNLLDNALKYGNRARLRLRVEQDSCLLEVDDDGPGIPEQMQQRVFDPFFRIETSRNRDTGGVGLGLASVQAIVLDHGGEITLSNRRGGGLRVTVWLPGARE